MSCNENGIVTGGGEYEVGNLAIITAMPNEKCRFEGWSDGTTDNPYRITVTDDITLSAIFVPDTHRLLYIIDGDTIAVYHLYKGDLPEIPAEPTKEGYTFSGWSEIPETMPAHDVTVKGSFNINSYKLTYMIDDKVYKETMYEYGVTITPEPQPEGDYQTFEWTGLPQTMPAHDVVVHANYTSGIIDVLMASQHNVRIYSPNGKKLSKLQKGLNIVIFDDGTVKKVMMK